MLSKKTKIAILMGLNLILILIGNGIRIVDGNLINPNKNTCSCQTELLWNYTMGDSGRGLAITPDGKYLAVGSWDGNLYFFDASNPNPLWNKTIPGLVDQVGISADGDYIVASGGTSTLYLFHKSSSTPIWNFTAGNYIRSISVTPDGNYIVIGSWDHNIYLFDRLSAIPIWNYTFGNRIYHVDISSNGNIIVAGGLNVGVHVFNMSKSTPLVWVNDSMTTVYGMDLSSNGQDLVVGTLTGTTGTIFLYNILSSDPIQEFETTEAFGDVSITSDGNYFVGAVSFQYRCYLFEKGIENPVWNFTAGNQIEDVKISGDGNFICFGSYDHNFYLFNRLNIYANLEKKEMLCQKSFQTGDMVYSVDSSENGEKMATISNDNQVYMFYNEISENQQQPPSISFGNFFLIALLGGIAFILINTRIRHKCLENKN
jgi:WD40 repeat protein